MAQKPSIETVISQLKAGEALRQQAIRTLEQELLPSAKKKGLSQEEKQRILARFYKNHVNQ